MVLSFEDACHHELQRSFPSNKGCAVSLYGKAQPPEQCGAWAVRCANSCPAAGAAWLWRSAPTCQDMKLPSPPRPRLGRRCQFSQFSGPCARSSGCALVQQGIIADLSQTSFLLWDRQNCPSYSRSPPRLLKASGLLTLHLALPSSASPLSSLGFLPPSAFQASYSKPASFKSVVKANPARQETAAPVRALADQYLLFHLFF